MDIVFRKAEEKDVAGIIKLCNECFTENTNLEYALKIFNETKDDSKQIYLIGIFNNEIIAHTKITIIPTMFENMNTYAVLNHFCVKKEYRRQNIATHMLEKTTAICLENDCQSIKLWSRNFRHDAHACYLKFGFLLNDAGFFSKEII